VTVLPGLPVVELTPELQRLLMARDDWLFRTEGNELICGSQDPFGSVNEMLQRIEAVLAFVAAIPTSTMSACVDHSEDDLMVRIDSVDDAIAFLQQLTSADRERLARSNTPLSTFADVTTPEQAVDRFQKLEPAQQMQTAHDVRERDRQHLAHWPEAGPPADDVMDRETQWATTFNRCALRGQVELA
jgi:hypothetical protein